MTTRASPLPSTEVSIPTASSRTNPLFRCGLSVAFLLRAKLFRRTRVEVIDGASHMTPTEAPDAVSDRLAAFLAEF